MRAIQTQKGAWAILITMACYIGCGGDRSEQSVAQTPGRPKHTVAPTLAEVAFDPATEPYVKREVLPIVNGLIDALYAEHMAFRELAMFEPRHIHEPFGWFSYSHRVKAPSRRKKAMIVERGGCSVVLFLEPFERKRIKDGHYATTALHCQLFPHKEFDNLAIRFNYEMRLGTPNEKLRELFYSLARRATEQIAERDAQFKASGAAISQPSRATDAAITGDGGREEYE